jgi:hypothetical protein
MQPDSAFNRLVEASGVSTTDLSVLANVTPRAAQLWRAGRQSPPQSLVLILTMLAAGLITLDWLAAEIMRWKAVKK